MALSRAQEAAAVILLAAGGGDISLAGGAGLVMHGVTDRDTEDLDAFTHTLQANTHELADRVRGAFERANYTVIDDSAYPEATLRRLLVTPRSPADGQRTRGRKPETIKVEIGQDFQALPSLPTRLGPVLDPLELGANKILTVYNITRARDSDDLARLAARHSFDDILAIADRKETEPLDRSILADQMDLFARLPATEYTWLAPEQASAVVTFMTSTAAQLRTGSSLATVTSPYTQPKVTPAGRDTDARRRAASVQKAFEDAAHKAERSNGGKTPDTHVEPPAYQPPTTEFHRGSDTPEL